MKANHWRVEVFNVNRGQVAELRKLGRGLGISKMEARRTEQGFAALHRDGAIDEAIGALRQAGLTGLVTLNLDTNGEPRAWAFTPEN